MCISITCVAVSPNIFKLCALLERDKADPLAIPNLAILRSMSKQVARLRNSTKKILQLFDLLIFQDCQYASHTLFIARRIGAFAGAI